MIQACYILIFISVIILWLKVKKYGLNLLRFNFAIFLIISFIPFSILYNNYFSNINSFYIYKIFFILVFLILIIIDKTKIVANKYSKLDIQLIKAIGFFSVLVIIVFVLAVGPQKFPLFHVLSGSYKELILMREDAYKNANIPQLLYYLVFYVKYFFIPLYVSLIILYWKYIKRKTVYIFLTIMLINQLLTLSKTAFFLVVLSALLTKLYMTKITLWKVFTSIVILTLVPLAILYLIVSDREILVTLGALGNRVFLMPEDSAIFYYKLYLENAFQGLTSSNLFAVFNQNTVINIQNYVFLREHPSALLQQGTLPGNIFGIPYVDINLYIIPLYHLLILVFLYWLNNLIIKYHSLSSISFFVSSSISMSFIYFTNFTTTINSYGIIYLIIIVTLLRSKQIKSLKRFKI